MHRIVSDCQNTRIYMYHLVSMILDGIICNDDVITAGVDTTRSRYEVQNADAIGCVGEIFSRAGVFFREILSNIRHRF